MIKIQLKKENKKTRFEYDLNQIQLWIKYN